MLQHMEFALDMLKTTKIANENFLVRRSTIDARRYKNIRTEQYDENVMLL